MLTATVELTLEEKAAAWDRYVALTLAAKTNEKEIETRKNLRYELVQKIENNLKAALARVGVEVEQCPGCGYDICICERGL